MTRREFHTRYGHDETPPQQRDRYHRQVKSWEPVKWTQEEKLQHALQEASWMELAQKCRKEAAILHMKPIQWGWEEAHRAARLKFIEKTSLDSMKKRGEAWPWSLVVHNVREYGFSTALVQEALQLRFFYEILSHASPASR